MEFPDEDEFDVQFKERLRATRKELDWTHARMADALRIKEDAYKKYEKRPRSQFPLYLLPRLIFITDRPYSYWLGGSGAPARFRVIK